MSDLNSLINQILSMVKSQSGSEDEKKKKNPNASWDDSPAGLEYWKDKRTRNTQTDTANTSFDFATKLADQSNASLMARQGLINTGGLDVENAKTKGLLDVAKEKETWAKNDPFSAFMEKIAGNRDILTTPEAGDNAIALARRVANPDTPTPDRAPAPFKDTRGPIDRLFNVAPKGTGAVSPSVISPPVAPPSTGSDRSSFYKDSVAPPPTIGNTTASPFAAQARASLPGAQSTVLPEEQNKTGLSLVGRLDKPWWERRKKQLNDLDESAFGRSITGR